MGSMSAPLGGTPFGDQSNSFANNLSLLGYNQKQADFANPTGNASVTNASGNLATAANYDLGILSGDRSKVLATEAPEISSLLSSYDAARKSAGQLTPRGGGRSATLNELPYKEAGDVNKLVQEARPRAAKDLTGVAEAQTYLGGQEQNLAANDVNSSLQFLLGKAGVQLDQAKLRNESGQAIGQAIGEALPQLLTLLTAA